MGKLLNILGIMILIGTATTNFITCDKKETTPVTSQAPEPVPMPQPVPQEPEKPTTQPEEAPVEKRDLANLPFYFIPLVFGKNINTKKNLAEYIAKNVKGFENITPNDFEIENQTYGNHNIEFLPS